jgi:hypothetical protein
LRAILQSRRRLNCRPGFIAGQSRHVALIWPDIELFTRSHNWTGLVPGQAWNAGSAGPPTTAPSKRMAANVANLFMVCLHWTPDQSFGGPLVRKKVLESLRPVGNETHYCRVIGAGKRPPSEPGLLAVNPDRSHRVARVSSRSP